MILSFVNTVTKLEDLVEFVENIPKNWIRDCCFDAREINLVIIFNDILMDETFQYEMKMPIYQKISDYLCDLMKNHFDKVIILRKQKQLYIYFFPFSFQMKI